MGIDRQEAISRGVRISDAQYQASDEFQSAGYGELETGIDRTIKRGAVFVKLTGFDAAKARVSLMSARIKTSILRGGLRAAASVMARGVKKRMPSKTGTLKASVRVSSRARLGGAYIEAKVSIGSRVAGGGSRGAVGAARGAFYAAILEGGARPHLIVPKSARALKVPDASADFGLKFRRVIYHPGVKPMRMWERTRSEDIGEANTAFDKYVERRIEAYWRTGK